MKIPPAPPSPLHRTDGDIHLVDVNAVLWRIHYTSGDHTTPWHSLRYFGPVDSRWDPHPAALEHPQLGPEGVMYATTDGITTAIAEVFQRTRTIDPYTNDPYLTGWHPSRPLRLLNLTDTWPLRNGAAATLTAQPKGVCRAWARAIRREFSDLDGLVYLSTMTSRPAHALFTPAVDTFPDAPSFSRPLTHPALGLYLVAAARETGYRIAPRPHP